MIIKKVFNIFKNFVNNFNNIEFFLAININYNSIQYGLLYQQGDDIDIIYSNINFQWVTYNGIINDYNQLYNIILQILDKINYDYNIKCTKIMIFLSIPSFQIINYHQKINKESQQLSFYFDKSLFSLVHDCGKFFLLDSSIMVENLDNNIYENVDIYESYYLINQNLQKQLIYQMDRLALQTISFNCPHYLLSGSISNILNNDIILIDIQQNNTIIAINHKKFAYNYFFLERGVIHLIGDDNKSLNPKLLQDYLNDLVNIINKYSKATVVIGGFKSKEFQWILYLQKVCSHKIFYLNQLTNYHNNDIFFNLIYFYKEILIFNNSSNNMFESIENIVL